MSDDFQDVGTTDPDAFGKLAASRRNVLRKRRLWEAEWSVRETEYGGLVAQLRDRAKSALRLSWLMLVVLCLIGAAGLGWLVADVMGWLTSDAEQEERRVLVANADARLVELNADKKALDEEFQMLRDNIVEVVETKFGIVNSPADRFLYGVGIGPNGEAVAVGVGGLIVTRAAGSPAWLDASLPGEGRTFFGVGIGANGEAFAVGDRGLIVTRGNESAAQMARQVSSNADLRVALLAAPNYPETQSWITALGGFQDRRASLSIKVATTEQDREAAAKGTLTAETRLAQMSTFLTDCAASSTRDGASEATIAACTAAYEAALADKENAFFEYLAQRLTPLALLIFLLGTLGGAYRYNARLAGFYHARADALEAAALSQSEDRLERLTTAFASENMPFKDARLPIDTAADFAKTAMGKVRGGAG